MAEKKQKYEKVVTPKGVGRYCWLTKPDTRFDSDGVYRTDLIISKEDAKDFIKKIKEATDRKKAEVSAELKKKKKKAAFNIHYPFEDEVDDDGNETGNIVFKFSQNATRKTKDGDTVSVVIPIFDAKGKQIKKPVSIYSGSVLKLCCILSPYYIPATKMLGVSLKLKAVQIIELVEADSSGASYGFEEEDGYTYDDADDFKGSEDEPEVEGDDIDDDF